MYKLLVITTTCASYGCRTNNKQWTSTRSIGPDWAHCPQGSPHNRTGAHALMKFELHVACSAHYV